MKRNYQYFVSKGKKLLSDHELFVGVQVSGISMINRVRRVYDPNVTFTEEEGVDRIGSFSTYFQNRHRDDYVRSLIVIRSTVVTS